MREGSKSYISKTVEREITDPANSKIHADVYTVEEAALNGLPLRTLQISEDKMKESVLNTAGRDKLIGLKATYRLAKSKGHKAEFHSKDE